MLRALLSGRTFVGAGTSPQSADADGLFTSHAYRGLSDETPLLPAASGRQAQLAAVIRTILCGLRSLKFQLINENFREAGGAAHLCCPAPPGSSPSRLGRMPAPVPGQG